MQMRWQDRITLDPKVLVGKPVVKGTRISVELIIESLGAGWSEQDIMRNYTHITHDDILACLQYAGAALAAERVYPIPA